MLKSRNFSAMFTADQIAKDFDIALETGRNANVPMPMTALVRQFYEAMRAKGKGNFDFFGLVTILEDLAGIKS
jgi:3-hydroxyisobutyrate dehydrogenase